MPLSPISFYHFLIFRTLFQGSLEAQFVTKKMLNTGRNNESFFLSANAGFENVRQGNYAFFCEESEANRVIKNIFKRHEICETRKIPFQRNDPLGIILRKYSPLRERFSINFLWLHEVGIYLKIFRHWNGNKLTCISQGHYESVRLEYLAPIFWILILAHILSIILFVGEIFIKKCSTKQS